MRPRLPTGAAQALTPVRESLLAEAHAEADTLRDDAHRRAEEVLASARATADRILAESREEGEQQARAVVAAALIRRRREARDLILAARRELYDELRARCRAEAIALRDDPGYPVMREELVRRAYSALGPKAAVADSPGGGVVASAGSRRLDLSLPTLVERELERLGAEAESLWTR